MTPLRLGAVSYLNTKPLVHGLDQRPDLFTIRYDVPAQCAVLLHQGHVDLGLVPAIEYQRGDQARVPIERVQTLALDTSSRTSVALTRILCAKRWGIAPAFAPAEPDLEAMLRGADAALVIGDNALAIDAAACGVTKYDLGAEWQALTGLPFVYAAWTGRPGAATRAHCEALQAARDRGVAAAPEIARAAGAGDPAIEARALCYLRDNLKLGLGDAETAGLRRFHELAAELGLIPALKPLRFYE
jgi:chorismate dehydratase